jgi:hypothetical protein
MRDITASLRSLEIQVGGISPVWRLVKWEDASLCLEFGYLVEQAVGS